MKKIILLIIIALTWSHFYLVGSTSNVGPGMLAGGSPVVTQADLHTFSDGDFQFQVISHYEADARVLNASKYYFDRMSRISPMDLAIGWDNLSDEAFINAIDFSITERELEWQTHVSTIDQNEIENSTELLHIIPKNRQIKEALKTVKIGDIVTLSGYLVNVKSATGLTWNSKANNRVLKRQTKGKIVYVYHLDISHPALRVY